MKFLCLAILCTVYVAAVFQEKADEEEEFRLLKMLNHLLEVSKKEEEEKKAIFKHPEPGSLYRKESSKKTLQKRGSYCFADDDCVFPFYYGGVEHNSCTDADATYYWCSHATNYSSFEGFSKCGCLGCEPHSSCVFPFTYKGVTYRECTDANHDQAWCSPTAKYVLGSGTYKNCDCVNCMRPPECTFPFEYNGQQYDECTTDGSSTGEYWCAKTEVYTWYGGFANCPCFDEF